MDAALAPPSTPCHPNTASQPLHRWRHHPPLAPAPPSAARAAAQGELSPIPSHLQPAGAGIARRDSDGAGMQSPYVSSQAHLLQPSDYNPMPTAVPPLILGQGLGLGAAPKPA